MLRKRFHRKKSTEKSSREEALRKPELKLIESVPTNDASTEPLTKLKKQIREATEQIEKQQVQIARMKTFSELHEKFSSTMVLEKLLSIVLYKAIDIFSAQVGSIWLCDDKGEGIECKIAVGPTKDKVKGLKVKRGAGIIGWVVENNKPSMVADCSKDDRFSSAVDKKIDFVTESMISAPLAVKGEVIGAIQIINKKKKGTLFEEEDLDFLGLFASSSAMYLKNAKLFESEKKAKELSALIEVSKEITSTLDLDAVLATIVNLSQQIIPYDEASFSLEGIGKNWFELKAISGHEKVDRDDEDNRFIEKLHNKIAQKGKSISVNSRDEYWKQSEPLEEVKKYMQMKNLESFWAMVLSDDQGQLGVFLMESEKKDMVLETKKELLTILTGQSTVALRNAQLYNTIPNSRIVSTLKTNLMNKVAQVRSWPKEKFLKLGGGFAVAILALTFVKVPYNVGANVQVVPISSTYYAEGNGKVEKVHVKEGQRVKVGELMVTIDTRDSQIELRKKQSGRQKSISEMVKLQSEGKIADFKIKEQEKLSLDLEIESLEKQIAKSKVVSDISGIVVSDKLDELVGMPVSFGQELVKVAREDKVFVHLEVPEADASLVSPGQDIKFKVYGHPGTSWPANDTKVKVRTLAGEGKPLNDTDPEKFFIATAEVANVMGRGAMLRPGMTGRGKIYSDWQPIGWLLFSKPIKFVFMEILF